MQSTPSLTGKVALVTGGSSGIGRATALAFAAAGARVVLAARGREKGEAVAREIRDAGGEALFVPADMGSARDIEGLVADAVSAYGRLDCACNNAATEDGTFALTADFDEAAFDRTMAVNLKGVWLCMREELRRMLAQSPAGGAIVNVSSVNGLGGAATGALYSASKAGVLALTKSAAQEYARAGVRVNALVAGAFRTPMLERVFERAAGGSDPEAVRGVEGMYTGLIPLARLGRPEEAAAAIVWLCSDAASYVTGHSMIVDGGLTSPMR
jgi:NAD(P)-dependent dehydrogenase (short-subunit alcohol dehydrogenase family)